MLEEATEAYEKALGQDVSAVRYLLDRGLDRGLVTAHRFGVVGEDVFPGHGSKRGWLAIPYLDRHGYPLTIRFRCLQNHEHRDYGHGKYYSVQDDPPRLFNIKAIHEAKGDIYLCEGEMDAAILNHLGLHAVGVPGANLWSGAFRRMLAGFSNIYILADADDAGAKLTSTVMKALRQAKPIRLPMGEDVNSTYLKHGADGLLEIIEKGK